MSEALRLAGWLCHRSMGGIKPNDILAAAELRRLHTVEQERDSLLLQLDAAHGVIALTEQQHRKAVYAIKVEAEKLRADAERYRKLLDLSDWYIGPSYSTYNDSICDGKYDNFCQDKTRLDIFLDAIKGATS